MINANVYRALIDTLPQSHRLVGTVAEEFGDGTVRVTLPGGGTLRVRGTADVGVDVYFKDGLIESVAPTLTNWHIEV